MKILVCGGREFFDKELIYQSLDGLKSAQERLNDKITHVIHGNARGVDAIAHGWAVIRYMQPVMVPALWELYGPKAGAIRNENMLALKPDLVVAFPGGRGTAHMLRIAAKAKIQTLHIAQPMREGA